MKTTIAVASPKGGVGKTLIAVHLAMYAAQLGQKTLLVDLDPLGCAGRVLDPRRQVLSQRKRYGTVSIPRHTRPYSLPAFGLDLLPFPGEEMGQVQQWECINSEDYAYVILDCPPRSWKHLGSVLQVTDRLILPITLDPLGSRELYSTKEGLCAYLPSSALHILINRVDDGRDDHKRHVAATRKAFPKHPIHVLPEFSDPIADLWQMDGSRGTPWEKIGQSLLVA